MLDEMNLHIAHSISNQIETHVFKEKELIEQISGLEQTVQSFEREKDEFKMQQL